MITLSSSFGDTIRPVMTSDTSYTFYNTVMLTGDVSVCQSLLIQIIPISS